MVTHSCRRVVFAVFVLVSFSGMAIRAQETAAAAKPGANAMGASDAVDQSSPNQKPQAGNQPTDATPSIGGMQTRILKEGEKIPTRKDMAYEDWSKPELTPGMKKQIVPLGKNMGDGFTRELVSVQWREMDPIDLWIVKPDRVKNPPVILYLYSYNANDDRYKDPEFCRFLTRDGFAAVGFVSALTEQRFHDRAHIQTFVSELQESLGATVHDVQMILNYLADRGDLDMSRVGMWGDGSGASIAIMAASVDSRIRTLDLLDPWGDWPDWIAKSSLVPEKNRAEYLAPYFQQSVENLEPVKLLPKLGDRKVRLQYIQDGITITPTVVREKMESAAPANVEIVHYRNTQEFVSDIAAKGKGFDWIKGKIGDTESTRRNLETKTSLAR